MLGVALISLLSAAASVDAHKGCGGGEIMRRNPGGPLIARDDTTWQQEATLSGDQSCQAYSYAPWADLKPKYPEIWETAHLVDGDADAQALFEQINATVNQKVPNIQPRGTPNGDWTGVNTTGQNTPDVCWWTFGGCDKPAEELGIQPDITTLPIPETWGYGFDDGPNCSHNAFYDFLNENQQKATMFFIGSNVADWPLQALRGVKDGHQICVHTWSHQYMTSFSNDVAFAELYYTRKIIKDILGVTPKCWRPPFGDVDNRIRVIAEGLNMTNIVWSDDTADWKALAAVDAITPEQVDANYQEVIDAQKNGSYSTHGPVVLTHELNNYTMSEAIKFYPQIKSAFKYVLPIATALNETHPYEEQDITFPNFEQYIAGQINASNSDSPSQLDTSLGSTASSASVSSASGSASGTASAGRASSSADASKGASAASPSESKGNGAGVTSGGVVGISTILVVGSLVLALSS